MSVHIVGVTKGRRSSKLKRRNESPFAQSSALRERFLMGWIFKSKGMERRR